MRSQPFRRQGYSEHATVKKAFEIATTPLDCRFTSHKVLSLKAQAGTRTKSPSQPMCAWHPVSD